MIHQVESLLEQVRPHKIKLVDIKADVLPECELNNCRGNAERTLHLHPGGSLQGGWLVYQHEYLWQEDGIRGFNLHPHYWIRHRGQHIDHSPWSPGMRMESTPHWFIADDGVTRYAEKNEGLVPPSIIFTFHTQTNTVGIMMIDLKEQFRLQAETQKAIIEAWQKDGRDITDQITNEDLHTPPFDISKHMVDGLLTNKVLAELGAKYADMISWRDIQDRNAGIQTYHEVLEQICSKKNEKLLDLTTGSVLV